jgi:hypothetical protein
VYNNIYIEHEVQCFLELGGLGSLADQRSGYGYAAQTPKQAQQRAQQKQQHDSLNRVAPSRIHADARAYLRSQTYAHAVANL